MKKEKSVKETGRLKDLAVPVIITAVILVAVIAIINFKGTTEQTEGMTVYSYDGSEDAVMLEMIS